MEERSDSNGALNLAMSLLPEYEHRTITGDTLAQESVQRDTTDRAFAAAQRAYEDYEDDQGEDDDEDGAIEIPLENDRVGGNSEEYDGSGGDEELEAEVLVSGSSVSLRRAPKRHHRQLDEDEWPDDVVDDGSQYGFESRSSWKTIKQWLIQGYDRFTDCPWKRSSYVQLTVISIIGAVILALVVIFWDSHRRDMFQKWIKDLGLWGNLFFILLFILTNLPFGIGFLGIVAMCGVLYPLPIAAATVFLGVFAGLSCCYWFIRLVLKSSFDRTVAANRTLQVLVFATRSHGIKLSFLIRYIPILVGLQTGVLAIADIPYCTVIVCGMLADLPKLGLIIYVANQAVQGVGENQWDPLHIAFYIFSGVLLIAAFVVIGLIGKRALKQANEDMERHEGTLELELQELPQQEEEQGP